MADDLWDIAHFQESPTARDARGNGKSMFRVLMRDEERRVAFAISRQQPGDYFWAEVPYEEIFFVHAGKGRASIGGGASVILNPGDYIEIAKGQSLRLEVDEEILSTQTVRS
ncbi:cupin domain-containing protein [Sphingomonas sp. TX0543]|uniref:cupin domain-containing protein n=1 Tax=unclassified Sphingomonas TaxID=196159 RepID=UPI0010F9F3D0|nr:cupin domain-containing protein [Sphingomonas sp. 3P27F8]